MYKLLSLDPGINSGYCLGQFNDNVLEIAYNEAKLETADLLLMLRDLEPTHIVYEDFHYRRGLRPNLVLFSVQLIGIVEAHKTIAADTCHVYSQTPAQGKSFYSDTRLKDMKLYRQGVQHGRDAARHLLHFTTFGPGFGLWAKGTDPTYAMIPYERMWAT